MNETTSKDLSGDDIRRLLQLLDQELQRGGNAAKIYVVGGANITLALDQSRTTNDIDVVVKQGFDVVFEAAQAVARAEPGLGPDWMNHDFTGGTPDGGMSWSWMDNKDLDQPSIGYWGPALTVELASPHMMLALKTLANRDKDRSDIYLLMEITDIRSPEDLGRNLARFTGRRIFDECGRPGMPFHIDPSFADIFEDAPPHLRPEPVQLIRRRDKPRCTHGRKYMSGGQVTHQARCTKPSGHRGWHRFRGYEGE